MADTVVIAEERTENSGYRFSWGLAIAGGVAATAVTFFLLSLGSGFGLLLVNPVTHAGPSTPTFLTGGAIYFLAAQAFGFAIGGHIAGRLLGPMAESKKQEEFRAEAHGLVVWAVTVLATVVVVAFASLNAGATTAALYGAAATKTQTTPSAYLVDVLFRPGVTTTVTSFPNSATPPSATPPSATPPSDSGANLIAGADARAEAGRIVDAGLGMGLAPTPGDRNRLIALVAANANTTPSDAANRIDAMQADIKSKAEHAANTARKIASYSALWIALSLLFGAIVSITAAMAAREEDDREALA